MDDRFPRSSEPTIWKTETRIEEPVGARTIPLRVPEGAVIIVRVANGWRLILPEFDAEGVAMAHEHVYEDKGGREVYEAESLVEVIKDAFDMWMASGDKTGLIVETGALGPEDFET